MRKWFFISLVLLVPFLSYSQKVFSVDYPNQSDIKVYVVEYENQCDLKVFKVDYPNQSDKKIYFVDYPNQSDFSKLSLYL